MASRESGDSPETGEEDGDDDSDGWLSDPWHHTRLGVAIVTADLLLTLALVVLTTELVGGGVDGLLDADVGVVPWHIYAFGVLGALGYVFTALTDDFHSETAEVIQYSFRLPAALPLAAGVFLLSDVVLPDASDAGPIVAGLAFLAGLYVNLTYKRLGALARRLLPERTESGGDGAVDDEGDRSLAYDESAAGTDGTEDAADGIDGTEDEADGTEADEDARTTLQ